MSLLHECDGAKVRKCSAKTCKDGKTEEEAEEEEEEEGEEEAGERCTGLTT